MADIKRMNQLIGHALYGRREECKNDEERQLYDSILRDMKLADKWGIGIDTVHETETD